MTLARLCSAAAFVAGAGLLLLGCDDPPPPLDVTMAAQVSQTEAGDVMLAATTNLPWGTVLTMSLEREGNDPAVEDLEAVYLLTVKSDGRVGAGPLTLGVGQSRLEPGAYHAALAIYHPGSQPKAVRTVLGSKGEHITGPLVWECDLDGTQCFKYEFSFDVTGLEDKAPKPAPDDI